MYSKHAYSTHEKILNKKIKMGLTIGNDVVTKSFAKGFLDINSVDIFVNLEDEDHEKVSKENDTSCISGWPSSSKS